MKYTFLVVLASCSSRPASHFDANVGSDGAPIRDGNEIDAPTAACPSGYADCNGDPSDGCEATLPCTGLVLLDGRDAIRHLVVDGPSLYWADNGGTNALSTGIHSMTTSGASPITFGSGLDLSGPVTDATDVYWGNSTGIQQRNKTPSTPSTVVPLAAKPGWMLVDSIAVYWVSSSYNEIWRANKQTWTPGRLETSATMLTPPALGAGVLFWAASGSPNVVILRSDPTNPGSQTQVTTVANEHVVTLAVVGSDLIWTARDRGEVMKMPIAGGPAIPLAIDEVAPVNLTCNATSCYWAAAPDTGTCKIRRISLQGGTAETYVDGNSKRCFSALAVDATQVYWGAYSIGMPGSFAISRAGQ